VDTDAINADFVDGTDVFRKIDGTGTEGLKIADLSVIDSADNICKYIKLIGGVPDMTFYYPTRVIC